VSAATTGILFVDDEPENVELVAEILREALEEPVEVVMSVELAVERLHARGWRVVVMDLFIPLGSHPMRVLGPRAVKYQAHVEHLGGLVLLEEIDRLRDRPVVVSHTACTDHVLLELFGDAVERRIPKPSPLDTVLVNVMDAVRATGFGG
jgi:CheY-like chemotaxis protein